MTSTNDICLVISFFSPLLSRRKKKKTNLTRTELINVLSFFSCVGLSLKQSSSQIYTLSAVDAGVRYPVTESYLWI